MDRIGAYAARYAAKNVVAAGMADACEVMVSYATGAARPVSLMINTFGTGKMSNRELIARMHDEFDFRPAGILERFALQYLPGRHADGFYQKLSSNGHVGREDLELPWERTDMFNAV